MMIALEFNPKFFILGLFIFLFLIIAFSTIFSFDTKELNKDEGEIPDDNFIQDEPIFQEL